MKQRLLQLLPGLESWLGRRRLFSGTDSLGLLLLAVLALLASPEAAAQTWQWAKQPVKSGSSNPNTTTGQTVRTDAAGNVYILGSIYGTSTYGSTPITTSGSVDITLSKLTAAGVWVWTTTINSSTSDSPRSMAVAPNGDVYVSGTYDSAPITIGSTPHANAGSGDIFIAKYNTSGALQWSAHAGGAGTDIATGMAVDPNNDLIVGGYFQQSTTFGSIALTRAGTTGSDVFAAKVNGSTGAWMWAKRGGGTSSDFCRGMDVDASGNVILVGTFRGTNSDFGSTLLTSNGGGTNNDVLVAKLDNNGNWLWAIQGGGAQSEIAYGAAVDAAGNVYASGTALGSGSFGSVAYSTPSTTVGDVFVAKATAAGVWQWVSTGGSASTLNDDIGYDVDVDASNNVFVTGNINSAGTFGGLTTGYSGSNDIFVAKLNSSGTWQWVMQAGNTDFEEGLSIAADDAGSAYIGGTFSSSSVAFGGTTLSSNPVASLYVAKVGIVNTAPSISAQTFSVAENTANGTTVGTVVATDPQGTTLTYSITAGNTGGAFTFVGNQLQVATSSAINYESATSFALTVQVSDGSLTSSATVTVNITNVNEAPSIAAQSFSINENTANTTTVGTVVASDPDASTTLTYSITAGNTGGAFTLVGNSLRVANAAALNFETTPTFSLTVQVSDGSLTSSATVTVNLNNLNEAPVFTNQGFSGVAENQANGTTIGTVAGSDPEGVTLSYTITAGNTGGAFTFVGNSLRVASTAALNFETTPSFTLTVQASDGTNTTTATVSVNLSNVNEAPSIGTQSFSINENAANGTTVGAVAASDPDASTTLSYSITAGNTGGAFTFVGNSLRVANTAAVDFETTPSFSLTVQVSDGSLTNSATVTVNLNDLDEIAPTISISSSAGASGSNTSTSPIPFTVTFSESVTGFVAGDVTVGNGTVSGFSGTGTTYTFNVTPGGAGTVTVNVAASVAQDGAGNGNTAATQFSITYSLPNTTVVSVTRNQPTPTATASVSYTVTFAAAVSGVTASNFSLTTTGVSGASVTGVSGSGTTYAVTVNTGTGNGTLRLDVASNSGITPTVTNVPYTGGQVYTITKSFTNPVLTIQGTGGTGSDVTAFVDQVQLLQAGTSTAVSGALTNGSFETHNALANGNYGYNPSGASWTFNTSSGIAENGSAFGAATAPNGIAVAFVQSNSGNNGLLQQSLATPAGSYQVNFQTSQRSCCTTGDQQLNVLINGVFVGAILPGSTTSYTSFTSAAFTVNATAPTDMALSNNTVAENAAVNTAVGSFSSTSTTPGETYTYTLVSGTGSTDNASFNISGNSLRTSAVFDFEAQASYSIRMRTTNSSNATLTYEEVFTIGATNVNEAPSIGAQSFSLAENAANTTTVGTIVAAGRMRAQR
jgi:hypothetical protein